MPGTATPAIEQPNPELARKVRGLISLLGSLSHDAQPDDVMSFVKNAVELVKEQGNGLAQMLMKNADFKSKLSGLSARNNGKTEKLVLDWLKTQLPPSPEKS